MLSYRHGFHAGNIADIHKHALLLDVLSYLQQKPKALRYIDTHAGAGAYDLQHAFAQKTQEAAQGIQRLALQEAVPPMLQAYLQAVAESSQYPGSPALVAAKLREADSASLYELHPTDSVSLKQFVASDAHKHRSIQVNVGDGFKGLRGELPCPSRRALVLIDPPYEVKQDYQVAGETIIDALSRMHNTVLMLWYPVVERRRITRLQQQLSAKLACPVWNSELRFSEDRFGPGMTASGVLLVNPPYGVDERARIAFDYLQAQEFCRSVHSQWLIADRK